MQINVDLKDRNGDSLTLGDEIILYDWGQNPKEIGTAILIWDSNEGRLSTSPCLIEDAYDFYSKALPLCINKTLKDALSKV